MQCSELRHYGGFNGGLIFALSHVHLFLQPRDLAVSFLFPLPPLHMGASSRPPPYPWHMPLLQSDSHCDRWDRGGWSVNADLGLMVSLAEWCPERADRVRFEVIGDPVVSDRPDMSPPRASVGTAALPPGLVGAVGSGRGVEGDGGRQCIWRGPTSSWPSYASPRGVLFTLLARRGVRCTSVVSPDSRERYVDCPEAHPAISEWTIAN